MTALDDAALYEVQAEREALLGTLRGALEKIEASEAEKEKLVRGRGQQK